MTAYRPNRNLVQRHTDGKLINVARARGNLFFCSEACCCGRTDLGNAPVPAELYHEEWMRRRLRNYIHLTAGGCLGPCALANVALLVLDGRALWFHSMNSEAIVTSLFDFLEAGLDSGRFEAPQGVLADHLFTASTWEPRSDGASVDDLRAWRGRANRPDATPACELPPDALGGMYDAACPTPATSGGASSVEQAVAAMIGSSALPRSNGELVFAEAWHSRAFGMAVALHEQGCFEWDQFRARLIARIAEAEQGPAPFEYYRCWLAALEDTLDVTGLLTDGETRERAYEFEFGERQDVY
jgi:nitrile hydratase accessory protein